MLIRLNELLKHNYREIVGSPLVLELMSLYSALFLDGSQPGYCEKCLKKYYSELLQKGKEMSELYEQIKKRTCEPKWNGLKYIPSQARHFDSSRITDDVATELLIDGVLRESHFNKLPDMYLDMNTEIQSNTIEEPEIKKTRKPRTKKA